MKKLGFIVMPLMAISLLASCNNGGGDNPEPTPDPKTIERTVSFNIPGCKMYCGKTEISAGGTKIEIPDVDPCYVKFSVKANDDNYMRPSDVILDKSVDYSFNKDNGDLFIDLQDDVVVTGSCDLYKTLEECTWSQIETISKSGKASDAFHIGDEKLVNINNKDHRVRIIGFNHDTLKSDKTKTAGITFEFANVITNSDGNADTTYWNNKSGSSSTNYKYSESTLNDYLNKGESSIFNKLPDELKADGIIKEVYKPVAEGSSYEISKTYTTNLFPLSYREITATEDSEYAKEEGSAYQFYTGKNYDTDNNRIKKKVGSETEWYGETYWLRSPYTDRSDFAWRVYGGGLDGDNVYYRAFAVAPAFCI